MLATTVPVWTVPEPKTGGRRAPFFTRSKRFAFSKFSNHNNTVVIVRRRRRANQTHGSRPRVVRLDEKTYSFPLSFRRFLRLADPPFAARRTDVDGFPFPSGSPLTFSFRVHPTPTPATRDRHIVIRIRLRPVSRQYDGRPRHP